MPIEPITYIDRLNGQLCKEEVYYDSLLRLMYGDCLASRFLGFPLRAFVSRCDIFSKLVGWYQSQPWTRRNIQPFVTRYGIDAAEFVLPVEAFSSFNDFFVRELKAEARPIAPGQQRAVIPADGRFYFYPDVSQAGPLDIKGKRFDLASLLGDAALAQRYRRASVVLGRLCPTDYHRFHFPVDCTPGDSRLMNGYLYSVNPWAVRQNISILWQNKRVVTPLHAPAFGDVLCVEIGATSVGTIVQTYSAHQQQIKGQEKGYFSFGGSALALIFPEGSIQFDRDLLQATERGLEMRCLMGQSMG